MAGGGQGPETEQTDGAPGSESPQHTRKPRNTLQCLRTCQQLHNDRFGGGGDNLGPGCQGGVNPADTGKDTFQDAGPETARPQTADLDNRHPRNCASLPNAAAPSSPKTELVLPTDALLRLQSYVGPICAPPQGLLHSAFPAVLQLQTSALSPIQVRLLGRTVTTPFLLSPMLN